MSIGRRFLDLARAELNSLLDRAATSSSGDDMGERDPDDDLYQRYGMSAISDEELEAELERRRLARERVAHARQRPSEAKPHPRPASSSSARPAVPPTPADELRRAYAALEIPQGSDFETVRASYRTLMRKYHPDRHAQSPEKQKAANEVAQKLTQSYRILDKHLRKR